MSAVKFFGEKRPRTNILSTTYLLAHRCACGCLPNCGVGQRREIIITTVPAAAQKQYCGSREKKIKITDRTINKLASRESGTGSKTKKKNVGRVENGKKITAITKKKKKNGPKTAALTHFGIACAKTMDLPQLYLYSITCCYCSRATRRFRVFFFQH